MEIRAGSTWTRTTSPFVSPPAKTPSYRLTPMKRQDAAPSTARGHFDRRHQDLPQNLTGQKRVVVQELGPSTPLLAKLLDSVPVGLDVHLDAFQVRDPGLGLATLLLRGL